MDLDLFMLKNLSLVSSFAKLYYSSVFILFFRIDVLFWSTVALKNISKETNIPRHQINWMMFLENLFPQYIKTRNLLWFCQRQNYRPQPKLKVHLETRLVKRKTNFCCCHSLIVFETHNHCQHWVTVATSSEKTGIY